MLPPRTPIGCANGAILDTMVALATKTFNFGRSLRLSLSSQTKLTGGEKIGVLLPGRSRLTRHFRRFIGKANGMSNWLVVMIIPEIIVNCCGQLVSF
jgi:hypothetical protein